MSALTSSTGRAAHQVRALALSMTCVHTIALLEATKEQHIRPGTLLEMMRFKMTELDGLLEQAERAGVWPEQMALEVQP